MRSYLVNVDIGVEVGGKFYHLGDVAKLDEKDGRVQELVNSGRLIPEAEPKKEAEAKKPDAKPEPEN